MISEELGRNNPCMSCFNSDGGHDDGDYDGHSMGGYMYEAASGVLWGMCFYIQQQEGDVLSIGGWIFRGDRSCLISPYVAIYADIMQF